jgi:rhomboid family GlyGly-CTERM serine protease
VILIAAVTMLSGDAGMEWLRFDRGAIATGELWRLLSGHLTHLGWAHFALNSAGLILVWYLVGTAYSPLRWLLIAAVAIATIDMGFWFLNPELTWYVGLSGLLHALLAAGILARLSERNAETVILAALIIAKLAWEQFNGPLPGSEASSGGHVIVDAHLYGAAGGLLGGLLTRIRV